MPERTHSDADSKRSERARHAALSRWSRVENLACKACGGPVQPSPRGPVPSYCSRGCQNRASYLRRKESGAIAAYREKLRKDPEQRSCELCSITFESVRDRRFCSDRCAQMARDRLNPECSVEGCSNGIRAKGVCSKHWKRNARAEGRMKSEPWSERRRSNWKKRYALTRGAPDAESFDYRSIYERDGWICGICDQPVDPALSWPDPLSVSLDHVVPVSKGGLHQPSNAQCSHLACNVSKGASAA